MTCRRVPDADADSRLLISPLARRGLHAVPVVWDDPTVDWSSFDLAVVRSCWDYTERRDAFLAWASTVPRLANPAEVLAWNTDKAYLRDLAARGIPVVDTQWVKPGDTWQAPNAPREIVIKPAISLSALDTGRYDLADAEHRVLAEAHVRRLHVEGRTVMVQPYLTAVDTDGEASLIFIDGRFSHAVRKDALLDGPDRGVDRRLAPNGGQSLGPCRPSAEQLALARAALAATPGGAPLLYARVDLIPGPDGRPRILEVELTEPSLYLAHDQGAPERLADAIALRCRSDAVTTTLGDVDRRT